MLFLCHFTFYILSFNQRYKSFMCIKEAEAITKKLFYSLNQANISIILTENLILVISIFKDF